MLDHQPSRPRGLDLLASVQAARAAGIEWTQLLDLGDIDDRGPVNPEQHEAAKAYLKFRQGLAPSEDPVTVQRAARVLLAPPDAEMTERVWGLAPGETDFGDVAAVLDEVAARIHRPAELTQGSGGGRHEAPGDWPVPGADHGD